MRRVEMSIALVAAVASFGCSGGGGGSGGGSASGFLGGSGSPGTPVNRVCDGFCENRFLSREQVNLVCQQAVNEAMAQGVSATCAVVDRVGNPLAVYEMPGAPQTVTIGSNPNTVTFPGNGLEDVPGGANRGSADVAMVDVANPISARFAAISKAGTAAYLSTQGNAFTTRTASQIIQEHFNPGEFMQAGGPLFGVQFSQLPCGDIARRFVGVVPDHMMAGPKSLPLGFSGDPGGVPLYINGDPVGAVGIEVDGIYRVDRRTNDDDLDIEEVIALAAQRSFEAPKDRESRLITVMGKFLRYADLDTPNPGQILSAPVTATNLSTVTGATLVSVTTATGAANFFDASGGVRTGTRFLSAESGYLGLPGDPNNPTQNGYFNSNLPSRMLSNPDGTAYLGQAVVDPASDPKALIPVAGAVNNPRSSLAPTPANNGLTAQEAGTIVVNALRVAERSRAQIRRGIQGPGFPFMQVNVSVVDLAGNLNAFSGTPDAPVFGTTVAIQKARTAAFISRPPNGAEPNMPTSAADDLMADVQQVVDPVNLPAMVQTQSLGQYVTDARAFLADQTALANGKAFSDRSGGNLSRPFFPDGIDGTPNGPFSKPISSWSPFNTGLQLDLILTRLLRALLFDPTIVGCTGNEVLEVRGGIQIFPGSVPIFKNGVLVGGIGISGDGVDQDDLIAFEGLKQGGIELNPSNTSGFGDRVGFVGNAPPAMRSDTIRVAVPGGESGFLRFVNCPPTPFLNSDSQNVCQN